MNAQQKSELVLFADFALQIQRATNVRAVVGLLLEVVRKLGDLNPSTEWINHHPLVVVLAVKVSSLTGNTPDVEETEWLMYCFRWCREVQTHKHTDYSYASPRAGQVDWIPKPDEPLVPEDLGYMPSVLRTLETTKRP
jgi:hypothetical protein